MLNLNEMPYRNYSFFNSQRPPKKMRPYMVKMVSNIYVHGIKEVYSSKTIKEKIFWVFLLVLCCTCMCYVITEIIKIYRQESHVATKIRISSVTTIQYPTLLMCPTKWVSKRRVSELGVDQEVVSYLWSIFDNVVPALKMDLNLQLDKLPDKIKSALSKTKSETLAELALNISINFTKDNVKCDPTCCQIETMKKIVTLHGVCLVLDLCRTSFKSREQSPNILWTINSSDAAQNFDMINGGLLAIYEHGAQISKSVNDYVILFADTTSMIKLHLAYIKRLPWVKPQCQVGTNVKSVSACEFECIDSTENRFCHKCSKNSIFDKNITLRQCSSNGGSQAPVRKCSKADEKKLHECMKQCLPPCTETIYNIDRVTSVSLPKLHMCSNQENVDCLQAVLYFPSFTKLEYEDMETTTFDTLISDIGGQTALWCGASVVSLCQMISYFCCPCLHWTGLRNSYASFRNFKKSGLIECTSRRRHSDFPIPT